MEKLKMHSPNLTDENIAKIRELFSGCVTEATDENGKLRYAVDFDQLRQELSDHIVEGPQERYRLDWPGKRAALLEANTECKKTLKPLQDLSIDFDNTDNVFIEGDNLEALKLIQGAYLGQVKMIYIDPPYNTGNDFIYNDKFYADSDKYKQDSGYSDADQNALVANTSHNGRFHSDWLSMMYPRIKLARNLLRDDGILFISISDVEQSNIRKLCEEIFGHDNVIAQIAWKARAKPVNIGDAKYRPQRELEYVLIVQKSPKAGSFFPLYTGGTRSYPYELNGRRYRLTTILKSNRGANHRSTMSFPLGDYSPPDGQRWQAGEEVIKQLNSDGYIEFKDGTPFRRYFEDEEGAEHDPFYCFMDVDWSSTSEAGKNRLNELVGPNHGFDTVKPVRLIKTLIQTATAGDRGDIVLDFFGGSGTTAEAVFEANLEDNGNRRFMLIQVDEACRPMRAGDTPQFATVSALAKARIDAARKDILGKSSVGTSDLGYRWLKTENSSFRDVRKTPDLTEQNMLLDFADNIDVNKDREIDLLFEILVDWGVDLTLHINEREIQGKTVFFVNDEPYDLIACFDCGVTEDLVKSLAKYKTTRVLFRDNGFISDSVKINAEQIFKQIDRDVEVRSI